MGLQDLVRWILPREDIFYGLIEKQVAEVVKAARALATFADGAPAEEVYQAVKVFEAEGDRLIDEADERFAQVFVTPIDREDIQLLIASLEDILDLLQLTARTFVLFAVPTPSPPMTEMMRLIVRIAEHLAAEIPALRRSEYARLVVAGRAIKGLEKEGDQIFRQALSDLFRDPAVDAKVLLRDKEVLEDLENAIDKFEVVADHLKHLAVKNG